MNAVAQWSGAMLIQINPAYLDAMEKTVRAFVSDPALADDLADTLTVLFANHVALPGAARKRRRIDRIHLRSLRAIKRVAMSTNRSHCNDCPLPGFGNHPCLESIPATTTPTRG